MKKTIILITIALFSVTCTNLKAQDLPDNQAKTDKSNSYLNIKSKLIDKELNTQDLNLRISDVDSSKLKSPILGAVLSAVIPGAGQFYGKNYIKTGIFLAVEAGLWVVYAVFQGKGNDQTTTYQNYANGNWDMRRYAQWLKDQSFTGSPGIDMNSNDVTLRAQINACESASGFSHQLPPPGDQQYYEVIGKYQTYIAGWSSAVGQNINKTNYETYHLTQVSDYMDSRQTANDYYNKGTTTLMVVLLNHLASAVDGVLTVNSYNNKYVLKGGVSFAPIYSYKLDRAVITPFANVSFTF
ncbi:MAG: hypothetical protein WCK13_06235 [Ignavibacteriota bacterium]|nr:hypothetical protein [Ignavibacteriota bacterium]